MVLARGNVAFLRQRRLDNDTQSDADAHKIAAGHNPCARVMPVIIRTTSLHLFDANSYDVREQSRSAIGLEARAVRTFVSFRNGKVIAPEFVDRKRRATIDRSFRQPWFAARSLAVMSAYNPKPPRRPNSSRATLRGRNRRDPQPASVKVWIGGLLRRHHRGGGTWTSRNGCAA